MEPRVTIRLGLAITLAFGIESAFLTSAQPVSNYAIQVSALADPSPPRITLTWPTVTNATSYAVERKGRDETVWQPLVALPGDSGVFVDTDVSVAQGYEYHLSRTTSHDVTHSYIYAASQLGLVESRGTVILVVDSSLASGLGNELAQLKQDLVGDGWTVLRHDVPRMKIDPGNSDPAVGLARSNEVSAVKSVIKADYLIDPEHVAAVFLIGHVPVPYSGVLVPDQHQEHRGAWPSDAYYGDMEGVWTDSTVNISTAADPRNNNVPGDGKFDQIYIPGKVALQVGRVDLANMPVFPSSELELLRQYLNKDHNYRQKLTTVQRRALIDDNFGILDTEIPAVNAWANDAPLFGASSIAAGHWLTVLPNQDYLWGYGSGSGTYSGAAGLADASHFIAFDLKVVFTSLFGSYFGDWDSPNNFMRAVLGSTTYTLTAAWVGRPYWYFHHMALGETIGFSTRLTQNNRDIYQSYQNLDLHVGFPGDRQFTNAVHIALMGDPTLRLHPLAPPNFLSVATNAAGGAVLFWTPSPDSVLGYNVYKASSPDGPFHRLNDALVTSVTYTDTASAAERFYMVRAVRLETSASGTYFNASQGVFAEAPLTQASDDAAVWAAGDVRNWTINDVLGVAGFNPGWETVVLSSLLNVTASPTSPFTVRIISTQADGRPAPPANFDKDRSYTWPILIAPVGVTGFDPSKINLVTGEFLGDLGGGTFRVALSADGKEVNLQFLPNQPPAATPAFFTRPWDVPLQISIPDLLAQYTSDPDGDARALVQFGSSTNGTTITVNGSVAAFTSPNNYPETISYWVQDVRPYRSGDTLRLANSTITITPIPKAAVTTAYHAIEIEWQGEVGKAYQLQFRSDTSLPWVNQGTSMPGTGQKTSIFERSSDATKFYRVIEVN